MSGAQGGGRPALLVLLAALLYLEALALAGLSVLLVVDAVMQHPDSSLSAVALIVLALLATVGLALMATHALAGRPWIRGAAVTWQILQAIVGATILLGGQPIGVAFAAVALAVLVVLFTPR